MIDDTLLEAEEKMDKAVTVAQEDFSNIRTGRLHPSDLLEDHGRVLRHADAAEPARVVPRARAADDHRAAVRQGVHGRDREGDQEQRPRA